MKNLMQLSLFFLVTVFVNLSVAKSKDTGVAISNHIDEGYDSGYEDDSPEIIPIPEQPPADVKVETVKVSNDGFAKKVADGDDAVKVRKVLNNGRGGKIYVYENDEEFDNVSPTPQDKRRRQNDGDDNGIFGGFFRFFGQMANAFQQLIGNSIGYVTNWVASWSF